MSRFTLTDYTAENAVHTLISASTMYSVRLSAYIIAKRSLRKILEEGRLISPVSNPMA